MCIRDRIYDAHREDLERERTDEEFMAMYEQYEAFDELEEEFGERLFILNLFLAEVLRVVVLNDTPVGLRVEIVVVDAVDNAPQAACCLLYTSQMPWSRRMCPQRL